MSYISFATKLPSGKLSRLYVYPGGAVNFYFRNEEDNNQQALCTEEEFHILVQNYLRYDVLGKDNYDSSDIKKAMDAHYYLDKPEEEFTSGTTKELPPGDLIL